MRCHACARWPKVGAKTPKLTYLCGEACRPKTRMKTNIEKKIRRCAAHLDFEKIFSRSAPLRFLFKF